MRDLFAIHMRVCIATTLAECRILPGILSVYTIFPSTNVIHIFSFRPSNLSFIFHHPEDFENPEKNWKNPFRVEVTIAIHSNQATETKKNQRKEWNGHEDRHLHDVLEPPKKRYHLPESVLRLCLPSNFTIFAYKICVEVLEKKCWDLTKKFKKFAKIHTKVLSLRYGRWTMIRKSTEDEIQQDATKHTLTKPRSSELSFKRNCFD